MSRPITRDEIKEILLPKEMLLYEAGHSKMAYITPALVVLAGFILMLPITWDILESVERFAEYAPHGRHLMQELYFGLVLMGGGLGMMMQLRKQSKNNFHFVTNLRVVERSKTFCHDDVQYILLHHIKFFKVKRRFMEMLTHRGRIIMEDDLGTEHIEITNVSHPEEFKKAITIAQTRFSELSIRAEKDGLLKQQESKKAKREKKKQKKEEERKERQQKRKKEQEEQRRRQEEQAAAQQEYDGWP